MRNGIQHLITELVTLYRHAHFHAVHVFQFHCDGYFAIGPLDGDRRVFRLAV